MNASRRQYLKTSAAALLAFNILPSRAARAATENATLTVGHGSHRYRVHRDWGKLDAAQFPVTDCHEMVEDSKGRLILFQTNVKNNVVIYDKSGKCLESWGSEYPGAHGMDLVNENGEEFLYLTDTKGFVYKTDLKGRQIFKLGRPDESGKYEKSADGKSQPKYSPTNIMPAPDGSFFVGDGYGDAYILHYDQKGKFLNVFGGKGTGPENLNNPHGGMVDTSTPGAPTLLICSRGEHALKRLSLDGKHLATYAFPGLRLCQIRRQGENFYIPSLNGVVSVLDKNLKVISNAGGTEPVFNSNGELQTTHQVDLAGNILPPAPKLKKGDPAPPARPESLFIHPHGICVDEAGNIYVAQWNSGKLYPMKLELIPA